MPRSSKSDSDFEDRYFDMLIKRLDKQDSNLESILEQVRHTNGRVTKLEAVVYDVPAKKDLPSVIRDPKFLQVMLYLSLSVLLTVGFFTKFDVTELLK